MLIGLDSKNHYEDGRVQLQSGDVVVCHSDGFTNLTNRRGDHFTEHEFLNSVTFACKTYGDSKSILNYIFAEVENFIGVEKPNDDITAIVIKAKF